MWQLSRSIATSKRIEELGKRNCPKESSKNLMNRRERKKPRTRKVTRSKMTKRKRMKLTGRKMIQRKVVGKVRSRNPTNSKRIGKKATRLKRAGWKNLSQIRMRKEKNRQGRRSSRGNKKRSSRRTKSTTTSF